jgi:hypothetical protein
MFNFLRKKLPVPASNEMTEVDTIQTWRVTWTSRYGIWSENIRTEVEFFFSEEEAKDFKNSLDAANRLLRNTSSETKVKVSKN